MAIFKRRKNQTVAELEDYYANKKTRAGMAWVMAVLSLLVTVAVISALFFGGRWIYRTVTKNDKNETTTTESTSNTSNGLSYSGDNSSNSSGSVTPSDEFPSVVSDQAASTSVPNSTRTNTPTPSNNSTATAPSKGKTDLPNTGAGEVLVIVPIIAMIFGYLVFLKNYRETK